MCASTYFLETFGCQMNVLDSELIAGLMQSLGLRRVAKAATANVILFNTCSVRQHAEDKVLSRLGRLKALKKRRPETVIGVLGCMAERQREELFSAVPHLDLICGPGELDRLAALLTEAWARRKPVAALSGSRSRRVAIGKRSLEADPIEALDLSRRAGLGADGRGDAAPVVRAQAYVRVQRGCDKFCTYCVVPFVRGPERSRPPASIVEECRRLVDGGCREITLLGQTVNSYEYTVDGRAVRFAELLEQVQAVDGLDRLRFVTSFPADWDEDIFRVMRDHPRICPYLHLPAQSGSDRILMAMKRGYTAAEYLRLVDTARRYLPEIALAGDFIVGFCGETEDDYRATVDLVRRVEYKSIFVFKYSPRPGTTADRHHVDDVPAEVKARRNNELLAIQSEISLRQKRGLMGQSVEVLVEGASKAARRASPRVQFPTPHSFQGGAGEGLAATRAATSNGPCPGGASADGAGSQVGHGDTAAHATVARQLTGRTPHDMIAVFDGDEGLIGSIVRVRVNEVSPLTLFGEIESVVSPPRTVRSTRPR